ncbi:MAG TPA: menaquinone biosynthesis protein [Daejeonella sp.]|nr:menaquinone biosynthesis protein [Daejeonella sp.]
MDKIRISAVSYTNTKPFVYGILHSNGLLDKIDLSLDIPSDCANKLIHNQADIGLVPVAALLHISNYQIITDYCIGATGPVNSVFIFSHKPIYEISTIRLDVQSRTSNNLALVLLQNYWKVKPEIVEGEADAFVEIGDRTFGKKNQYPYAYDLAEQWQQFTGLPFAFAVWASNKPIPEDFIAELNAALKLGLDSRPEVIQSLPPHPGIDLEEYLMHNLDFDLDAKKRQAIHQFHQFIKALEFSRP